VFKYESEDGKSIDVTGKAINDHIKEVMGYRFSAKDFRTWAGTLVCACLLAQESEESRGKTINAERKIKGAIKITSEVLGNTPAVCRKAYVCPAVLSSFKRGVVIHCGAKSLADVTGYRGRSLHPSERGLLRLLKKSIGNSQ
jgi:DNA topoisomerase-1